MPKVRGFMDGLKDLGFEKVRYNFYKGNNTLSRMRELAQELALKQEDYDLIAVGGAWRLTWSRALAVSSRLR